MDSNPLVRLLRFLFEPRRLKRQKKEQKIRQILAELNAREQALGRMI